MGGRNDASFSPKKLANGNLSLPSSVYLGKASSQSQPVQQVFDYVGDMRVLIKGLRGEFLQTDDNHHGDLRKALYELENALYAVERTAANILASRKSNSLAHCKSE